MGLIDLNFYQEAPVASVVELVTSCVTAAGAIGTVVLAYMAYRQTKQITLDSVIPHCNIAFSVTKGHFHVIIENTGLGPLILNSDPVFTFNMNPVNPSRINLRSLLFPEGHPQCVKDAQFFRRSLHANDSLRVGDKRLLIEYNFAGDLEREELNEIKERLAQGEFRLEINYRSIYKVNLKAERRYENNN